MGAPDNLPRGITGTLRRLSARLVAVLENRFELLVVELREEQRRLVEVLVLGILIGVFALLALLFASFALVALFWEQGRFAVLGGLIAFYGLGAGAAAWRLRRRLKDGAPFQATVGELRKDREWLEGHHP
jgi:uncharacterized membrane protein YqjE